MTACTHDTPYATVIIPTHDRSSTLAMAVASVQRQTVRDLEIIIAGDGVTESVREVAQTVAANDSRVVFCDWPKAPGRGYRNRDRAVRQARAVRIFYNDDDDLWLENHVATLGPILDHADVVDSPCVSVSTSGRHQLALVNHSGNGLMRRALAQGRAKLIFDTHFAHRKEVYLRLGYPWLAEGSELLIMDRFFATFAGDHDVVWLTVPRVTALSLHGAARRYWSAGARSTELAGWSKSIEGMQGNELMGTANVEAHFLSCLCAFDPKGEQDMDSYLASLGLALGPESATHADSKLSYPLSAVQRASLRATFDLYSGRMSVSSQNADLVVRLVDPLLGVLPQTEFIAGLIFRALGTEQAITLLNQTTDTDLHSLEMADSLRMMFAQTIEYAREIFSDVLMRGAAYPGPMHAFMARVEQRFGNHEEATAAEQNARELDPKVADDLLNQTKL